MSEDQGNDKEDVVVGDPASEEPAAVEPLAEGEELGEVADDFHGEEPEDEDVPTAFVASDPSMLLGEMRDHVLGAIKVPVGWKNLSERKQVTLANEVEQACRQAIRGASHAIADMDFDSIEVTIKDPGLKSDKEMIEAKIIMADNAEAWAKLREHSKWVLVFVGSERLMGARAAEIMKDQPALFWDGAGESPAEKAKREAIDKEAAEREASEARARMFGECDPPKTRTELAREAGGGEPLRNAASEAIGSMLDPKVKAAADRGVAHGEAGGAKAIPRDLEGKPVEIEAWSKGYDIGAARPDPEVRAADVARAENEGLAVDPATGEVKAKPPRGHRGKRTTVEERVAKRVSETTGA